jgi:predicted Zn finger-like uncharacterized protein
MTLACPSCPAQYNLDESRIPVAGMQLRCPKCGTGFPVTRPGMPDPVAGASGGKVELPSGGTPPRTSSAEAVPAGQPVPLPPPADAPPVRTTSSAAAFAPSSGAAVPLPAAPGSPSPPPIPRRSSTAIPVSDQRVPLPASGQPSPAAGVPPPASELDIDELFGMDAMPAPRATPVIEIQHPKTATAEMPIAASDLDLASEPPGAPTVEAPQSLDLGMDLGVAVPAMSQVASPRKTSSPGIAPASASRAAPSIPAPRVAPAAAPRKSSESIPVTAASAPASSPPPARPTPTLGRGQGKKRYQIRRVSGKVFGPFDEERITRMLVDGELAGTESVKADDEDDWEPMASVAAFAEAVPRPAPAAPAVSAAEPSPAAPESEPPPMDPVEQAQKLQQVYGERMAAMTIVERIPLKDRIRKILPLLVGGAGSSWG